MKHFFYFRLTVYRFHRLENHELCQRPEYPKARLPHIDLKNVILSLSFITIFTSFLLHSLELTESRREEPRHEIADHSSWHYSNPEVNTLPNSTEN